MAGRADFGIDLIAALGGGAVVGAERPVEMPVAMRRMLLGLGRGDGLGGDGGRARGEGRKRDGGGNDRSAHGPSPPSS